MVHLTITRCPTVQEQLRKIHIAMGLPVPPSLAGTPTSSPANSSRGSVQGHGAAAARVAGHVPRPGPPGAVLARRQLICGVLLQCAASRMHTVRAPLGVYSMSHSARITAVKLNSPQVLLR